jgi:NDP-sugar pyrophosphorylase family protein
MIANQMVKLFILIINFVAIELLHFHEKSELVLSDMINCGVYLLSTKAFELEPYVKLGETYRKILELSKDDYSD